MGWKVLDGVADDAARLMKKIARLIFSRTTMVFYEHLYGDPDPWRESQDGLTFRSVLPSDLPGFASLLALQRDAEKVFLPADMPEVEARLSRGEKCYICESDGRIIGYSWFAKESKYIPEIRSTILLGSGDLYLYNSYILKAHRRQNVVGGNLNAARKDFIPGGFVREITATMSWNRAAGGSLSKLNFKVAGLVTTGYLFTFRYMINTCKDIAFLRERGTCELYRRLFARLRTASFSRKVSSCRKT